MKITPFCYLPAVLLLALIACSNTDEPIVDENLLDVVSRVDSLITPDTSVVTDPKEQVTIQFTRDEQVKGSTGCRWCEGKYLIREAGNMTIIDLTIDITDKYCGERLEFLTAVLVQTLEHITRYDLGGNRLTLHESDNLYVIYSGSE